MGASRHATVATKGAPTKAGQQRNGCYTELAPGIFTTPPVPWRCVAPDRKKPPRRFAQKYGVPQPAQKMSASDYFAAGLVALNEVKIYSLWSTVVVVLVGIVVVLNELKILPVPCLR